MMQVRPTATLSHPTRKEEALWLLESVLPGTAANNLSLAFLVDGRLSHRALQCSLQLLVRRYEALRTVFVAQESELGKRVLEPDDCDIVLVDAEIASEADLIAVVARPFALDGQLLLRAGRYMLGNRDACCITVHHLIFDTISSSTLLRELVATYEQICQGTEPAAQPPVSAYVEPMPTQESLQFWREQLAGFDPATLELSYGTVSVPSPTLAGDRILHTMSAEATGAVRALQKELRAPEAVVLLAGYLLLLNAHGAGPDLVVGSPVDVRPSGAAGSIGYHVNVLPLRVHVDQETTFRQLVRTTRDVFFDAVLRADVPVDNLTAERSGHGGSWRNSLFRHLFNYVTGLGLDEFQIGELTARPIMVENGYCKFDLEFFVLSSSDRILVRAVYGTEFLSRDEVQALLARYEELFCQFGAGSAGAIDRPVREIAVWSGQDRAIIGAANCTDRSVGAASVLAAVREKVRTTPDAVAVVDGDRSISYRQLWSAAQANHRTLVRAGTNMVVAIIARRSPELAAAVLGAWLAGAAYLPLDPEHPQSRIAFLLADSGTRIVLTDDPAGVPSKVDLQVLAPAPVGADHPGPDDLPAVEPTTEAAAYLIYTSGSTGMPKGTVISHRSLSNVVEHFVTALHAVPETTTLWSTTFAFDISALELFLPLVSGGTVVVAPNEARLDGRVLRDLLERERVDIVQATPTTWRSVLDQVAGCLYERRVLVGGEPAPTELMLRLQETGCRLHHVYGPTETTIWSTSGPVRPALGRRPDIGRPIANTRVMVLDPHGRSLPVGVSGELCIAGAGVALRYHDQPELTADRFRTDPVHGRYYCTGDTARWRADGTLELLGRNDRQIKLRGNRIELGEIEAALLRHSQVKAAAVVVVEDPSADATLVGFVETTYPEVADSLWQHCLDEIPRSMIPQDFVVLDALPTNSNEKVDYPALTRLAEVRRAVRRPAGPATQDDDALVATLIGLWRRLLERPDVDADTHFFGAGGHSLLGARLVQLIEEETGAAVRLADLFADPTPVRLAGRLREISEV